jgi:hypothetical protein
MGKIEAHPNLNKYSSKLESSKNIKESDKAESARKEVLGSDLGQPI